MSKFLFNSFANNIKSQVSCFHLSPFPQKRLILRLGEAGSKFHRKSVPERKHAFSLLYSDCTDGLFDIGGLFHTEVIKANIDLHMDMLPGNMKRSGDEEIC